MNSLKQLIRMRFRHCCRSLLVGVISLSLLGSAVVMPVQAAMVSTQAYVQAADRQAHLATVERALMREDVQRQMVSLGVDPADAWARVSRLPDRDLARLADEIDAMPAGGDSVFAVIGVVFVVLLVLEVTGVIDIFKGT